MNSVKDVVERDGQIDCHSGGVVTNRSGRSIVTGDVCGSCGCHGANDSGRDNGSGSV